MISHSRLLLLVAVFSLTANAADTLKEKPLSGANAKPSFKLPNTNTTSTSGAKPILKRPAPVGLAPKAKLQTSPKISSPQIKPGFKTPTTSAGIKPGFKGTDDTQGRHTPSGVGAFVPTLDSTGLGHKGTAFRPNPGNVSPGSGPNSQAGFTGADSDVQGAVPDPTISGGVNAGAGGANRTGGVPVVEYNGKVEYVGMVPIVEGKAKAEPIPGGSAAQTPFVDDAPSTGGSSTENPFIDDVPTSEAPGSRARVTSVGGAVRSGDNGLKPGDKDGVGGSNPFIDDVPTSEVPGSRARVTSVGGAAYEGESGVKEVPSDGFKIGVEGSKSGFGSGVQPHVTSVGGEVVQTESYDKAGFGGGVQPQVTRVGGAAYDSESGPKPDRSNSDNTNGSEESAGTKNNTAGTKNNTAGRKNEDGGSESDSDDNSSNDDSDSDNDNSSSDESDTSSESSDESTETETDTGDEAADESQTGLDTDSYGGYSSEGKDGVDSAARVGTNTVEETAPGNCGDGKGGQAMDQQEADNCLPGGMPGKGDEDDDDPKPPGADSIWQAPSSSGGVDTVIQPGIDDEQFNDEGMAPLENIGRQIDSVTNPGGN